MRERGSQRGGKGGGGGGCGELALGGRRAGEGDRQGEEGEERGCRCE